MMWRVFLTALLAVSLAALCGCSEERKVVNYSKVRFEGRLPHRVFVDTTSQKGNGFVRQVDLQYSSHWGDTLWVSVLEFKGDVYALDYYMNSGRFQGAHAILRGKYMEQSLRSDYRIFVFRHDSFRRYERRSLESYVRAVPGVRFGFPQEFLSLPFEHRETGRTTVQTSNFLGLKSMFPVLEQSYSDGNLKWNVARSWDLVEESVFGTWKEQLPPAKPRNVEIDEDVTYFLAGDGARGMTEQLAGGRVVVVWGYLDWPDLEQKFRTASDRIFEARY